MHTTNVVCIIYIRARNTVLIARVCILLVTSVVSIHVYSTLEYAYENNITREYAYYELVLEYAYT